MKRLQPEREAKRTDSREAYSDQRHLKRLADARDRLKFKLDNWLKKFNLLCVELFRLRKLLEDLQKRREAWRVATGASEPAAGGERASEPAAAGERASGPAAAGPRAEPPALGEVANFYPCQKELHTHLIILLNFVRDRELKDDFIIRVVSSGKAHFARLLGFTRQEGLIHNVLLLLSHYAFIKSDRSVIVGPLNLLAGVDELESPAVVNATFMCIANCVAHQPEETLLAVLRRVAPVLRKAGRWDAPRLNDLCWLLSNCLTARVASRAPQLALFVVRFVGAVFARCAPRAQRDCLDVLHAALTTAPECRVQVWRETRVREIVIPGIGNRSLQVLGRERCMAALGSVLQWDASLANMKPRFIREAALAYAEVVGSTRDEESQLRVQCLRLVWQCRTVLGPQVLRVCLAPLGAGLQFGPREQLWAVRLCLQQKQGDQTRCREILLSSLENLEDASLVLTALHLLGQIGVLKSQLLTPARRAQLALRWKTNPNILKALS